MFDLFQFEFNRVYFNVVDDKMNKNADKPTCADCGQKFDRKYNLTRHMRVHKQKVENVRCSECGKTFANNSNLRTHFIDIHPGKEMESKPEKQLVSNKGILVLKCKQFKSWYENQIFINLKYVKVDRCR